MSKNLSENFAHAQLKSERAQRFAQSFKTERAHASLTKN